MKRLVIVTVVLMATVVGTAGQVAPAAPAAPAAERSSAIPPPPKLPRDFVARGRYIVADLGIDVPFTWEGHDGDSQMIAGSDDDPIHFTNVIADGQLYTLTYKWPGLSRRPCSAVGALTLEDFNQLLAKARYAGAEVLVGKPNRRVHHFRAGVVWEPPLSVVPPDVLTPVGGTPDVGTDPAGGTGGGDPVLRIPLMIGDFYVDRDDPTTFWQVLHFGVQNLYDAELDEWMVMKTFRHRPGEVDLPDECRAAGAAANPAAGFTGLAKSAAIAKAEADGRPWRVGREDDESFALTADLIENRVTFEIDDGKVTKATFG